MNEVSNVTLERQLRAAAATLAYPPTPDLAVRVRAQLLVGARPTETRRVGTRLVWTIAVLLIALAAVLAVPSVRAGLADVLRIGSLRIFLTQPTPVPTPARTPSRVPPMPAASVPPTPVASVFDLAGATTLEDARARAEFSIQLPDYPEGLGPPDVTFVQEEIGQVIILVWLTPEARAHGASAARDRSPSVVRDARDVRLILYEFTGRAAKEVFYGLKTAVEPVTVGYATVNGRRAAWIRGTHVLSFTTGGGELAQRRLVTDNVLVWEVGTVTYHLEADLPADEAIRIAESLR